MDYDYIKQIIPEKRPFFTESNGIFAFSSGMLLVLENDDTNEWYNAIISAIDRFVSGDYGNFYEDEEYISLGHEYGSYESPFGNTVYDGSIVIHAEKHIDSFGTPADAVIFFSFSTYDTYNKVGREYGKWLADKGVKYGKLTDTEQYAREYIETRLEDGKSVYTLKMERSALGMIYGHNIEVPLPIRHNGDVKRSREETINDKHISRTGKLADIFVVATGCRRSDLKSLNVNSLIERNGKYFLEIKQSKGGRDRIAPVLPSKADEVKKIFEYTRATGKTKLFDNIPKEIDVHGLRREYAQELYHTLSDEKSLRDDYLSCYPARHENVKSDYYRDREGNVFERDTVYVVSQALGHNRIDTSITAYLK